MKHLRTAVIGILAAVVIIILVRAIDLKTHGYDYGIAETSKHYERTIDSLNSALAYCRIASEARSKLFEISVKALQEELDFFKPESLVLIDGILYERANGANWAWNDGVLYVDTVRARETYNQGVEK